MSARTVLTRGAVAPIALAAAMTAASAQAQEPGAIQLALVEGAAAATSLPAASVVSPPLSFARILKVDVEGYATISGDFRVDPALRVTFPILGRISVKGHTVESFEKTLADRVLEFTSRQSRVTVEVAEYQPIFVTGAVAAPGTYPWSANVTALTAKTLAGGIFRRQQSLAGSSLSRERMNLGVAVSRLKLALARRARYETQKSGEKRIELPAELTRLVGEAEAKRLVRAEQSFLDNERRAVELQRAAQAAAARAAEAEDQNLDQLEANLADQVARRGDFSAELARLKRRGVISEARLMEAISQKASLDERLSSVRVSKIQLESRTLDLERDRVRLESERMAELELQLADVRAEIEQAAAMYEAAALEVDGAGLPTLPQESSGVAYAVARHEADGRLEVTRAAAFASLMPGDVVIVCKRYGEEWPISEDGACRRPVGAGALGLE